uniref:Copia protein n=1 Tax=Tanacetum cinerariifolium TaxID=118510 RepID=A0A6L2KVC2_TANCI|nr:copia protein [Tanacetum cinerariifolium]
MEFLSSSSNNNINSSNEAVNTAFGVTTADTQINAANSTKIDNLSDAIICAFLVSQSNSSQLVNEDLEQIHPDDLEEIDLKWQMAILTMKGKRFLKNIGRKLNLNMNDIVAFDKTKVECYNFHKRGHFARECRAPRAQDNKNKESTKRNVLVETTNSSTLVSCDGLRGYDWSDQAEEGPNYALMAYSTSSSDSEFKRRKMAFNTVEKLENASKSLNKLIDSQIVDNYKKGLGYNAVPPPHTCLFMPPKPDLSYIDLEEFTSELAVETLNTKTSEEVPKVLKKDNGAPIIKDWKSDDEDKSVPQPKIEKKTVKPSVAKVEFIKPKQQSQNARKSVKNVEKSRQSTNSKRDNQRNWNYLMSQRLKPKAVVNIARRKAVLNAVNGQSTNRLIRKRGDRQWMLKAHDMELIKDMLPLEVNPKEGKSLAKMCDKKNSVFLNDTKCVVLSPDFKLTDENHILLRVPGKNNMYSVDLKNIIPKGSLTCLFTKATSDASRLLHRRLGHLNFKIMNKLVKENLDETSGILKSFITRTENLVDHKVKAIRYDNGTEFKNKDMNQFCEMKEAVSTACYVQNRVLVVKPHNKTPYALFHGRTPILSFIRPFGCLVTILNTIYHLGIKDSNNAGQARKEKEPGKDYILLPLWTADLPFPQEPKSSQDAGFKPSNYVRRSLAVNAASNKVNAVGRKSSIKLPDDPNMPKLEDISIFEDSNEDVFGAEADLNNLEYTFQTLVDLPYGKRAIGSKWVFRNKLDERGIMIRNKVRLVAQGHTQEEGIDYDEVFAPVARIKAIRLFLVYASFRDFVVYQMDVKSAFLYGKIKQELYVCQSLGFKDLDFSYKVYKLEKVLYGLHQASRACDYAGASLDKKSTIGGCQFLGCRLISWKCKKQSMVANSTAKAEYVAASSCCGSAKKSVSLVMEMLLEKELELMLLGITYYCWVEVSAARHNLMRDLQLADEDGIDCLLNLTIFKNLALIRYEKVSERLTFYKSLFFYHRKFLIHTILQCLSPETTAWNKFSSTIASAIICLATNITFNFSKMIFDGMLRNLDNVSGKFLMYPRFIETFLDKQLDGLPTHIEKYDVLFNTKKVFANMKRIDKGFSGKETPLFLTMVGPNQVQTSEDGLERRVKKLKKKQRSRSHKLKRLYKVGLTTRVISSSDDEALDKEDTSKQGRIDEIDVDEDITLVVTTAKMIIDAVVDDVQVTTAIADILVSATETIITTALTITSESTKTNVEVTQAPKRKGVMIQEPEETTITKTGSSQQPQVQDKEKRRKLFAAKRDEEKRNKPPTKSQQRSLMTELVVKGLKKDEVIEGSLKRTREELEQETAKKQKIVDDKETANLKQLVKIIPGEDIAINYIPLDCKTQIVNWKIYKEGKKSYYQIIRAVGKTKNYLVFSYMLKDFNREDVETLWKLVKAKYGSTRPEEDYERVLRGDLKVMFDPYVEDEVLKLQQTYKRYPLTPAIIINMLNKKLHADYFDEMTYQLLILVKKQLKEGYRAN